jgi:hypothetical protein
LLIAPLGLLPVALGYLAVILVFALVGLAAQWRLARSREVA